MHPELPPSRIFRNKLVTYACWIDCRDCGKSYAITTWGWGRLKVNGGKDLPRCPACVYGRKKILKELARTKNRVSNEAALAGIPKGKIPTVKLRKAPASGVPRYSGLRKAWYIPYFFKSTKGKDEKVVVLEATTEAEAVEEAREWYVKALLHGATWLPDDFSAERPQSAESRAVTARLRMIWNKAKRKRPIQESIKRRPVKVTRYRYKVVVNGKIIGSNFKNREQAIKAAREANPPEKMLFPKIKKCKWCGQLPVGDGCTLKHISVDCANLVGIRTQKISWRYKVAIWNEILRFGTFAGNDDFQREHALLVGWSSIKGMLPFEPPAETTTDPLDGFEI